MRSHPVILPSLLAVLALDTLARSAAGQTLLGTCCHSDGSCTATTPAGCPSADPNNLWLGGCSGCEPAICLIACCAEDGSCVHVSPNQCDALGGTSQGSVTTCAPLPACPFTLGSCCFPDGSCMVLTRIFCQNSTGGAGVFQGAGSAGTCNGMCDPQRGACCRGAQCVFVTQAECAEHRWAGPLVTCIEAVCCPVDHNASGTVSVQDLFEFLADYFAVSVSADFNSSCTLSVQDIFEFLAAYFTGCA